ncbi:MAG TPA: TIGR03790 family protein [Phycisphaerae bacterium]|nr:TIGR03790 family protein [Phycisphaerae bacterium]
MHLRQTLAACALLLAAASARALEPKEIAVICNTRNDQSVPVAEYYLHARGIPHENLIDLNCSPLQRIPEIDYRTLVVPEIRKAIKERNLDGKIKCLVTVCGCPLIIDSAQLDSITHQEIEADKKQFADVLTKLNAAVTEYETLAGGTPASQPESQPATNAAPNHADEQLEFHAVLQRLNAAGTAAATRLSALSTNDRPAAIEELLKLQMKVAGINGCLAIFRVSDDTPNASLAYARRDAWQAELNSLDVRLQELAKQKLTHKTRQELIDLQARARGLIGQANQIESTISDLTPEETESAFDNELSLVFADQDYPRYRWIVNADSLDLYQTLKKFPQFPRPIMVSRIDGASIDQVTHMIDTTLKVERTGLEGKIYLDARGLHGTDGYAAFDADIRRAADWLTSNADINVVLDDNPALLEARNCPNAALYCGWYSLHHYVDSCQWLPGAVGYHVASLEMPTLHDPNDTGWVPNLLKRGFCGTLGAVSEPYLTAFPKPSQFFPLLLSGQFTQGEVWQVTMPLASWRIAYVGDPLYNPYKVHPRVKVETLKADTVLRNAFEILGR